MVHIFGVITVEFSLDVSYRRKNAFRIMHCGGIFYLAYVSQSFNVFQCLFAVIISINYQTIFHLHLPSLTPIFYQFSPFS